MIYESDDDFKIIEKIARYPEEEGRYDTIYKWFNCNLCMADDKQFDSAEQLRSCLRSDNKTLFKFILVYYFEQLGFNVRVKPVKCENRKCEFREHGKEVRRHAVAMLKAFNEVALMTDDTLKADVWFNKFGDIYKKHFEGEFSKKLREPCFESLSKFYEENKVDELRERIESSKIKNSYDLLWKEIKGIGDKVAKFIVRDLLFLLTDWGNKAKMESAMEHLEYATPVDVWVRRITLSIPTLKRKVFDLMKTDEELEKFISKAIVQVCSERKVNPLTFDFGAYLIGKNEITEKWWKKKNVEPKFDAMYARLKSILLK